MRLLLTFHEHSCRPKRIHNQPLALHEIPHIPHRQRIPPIGVLGKDLLKLLGHETALVVVGAAVATVLGLVDVVQVDSKKGVGEDAVDGGVGEASVYDDGGEGGNEDVETEGV